MGKSTHGVGRPAALTFLLQLSVDLRLPPGATLCAYEQEADIQLPLLVDQHETVDGLFPDTRFVFRRSAPDSSPSRSLVLETFADFWKGLDFRDSAPAYDEVSRAVPVTVVAATTGVRSEGQKLTPEEFARTFDRVLDQLNALLTMLGFSVNDADIGPVRRTELPSHIAVVIDQFETPRVVELSTLQLHSFGNGVPPDQAILSGHDLAFRDRLGWPFHETISSFQRARREIYGGETAFGVLLLGTASELLIATSVRECMRADGRSESRIAGVAQAPFRSIKDDHFAPLLERIDADMATLDAWTRDCYRLRNAVAHEGRRPTDREAQAALRATLGLAGELGDQLRATPTYRSLGDQLPVTRSS